MATRSLLCLCGGATCAVATMLSPVGCDEAKPTVDAGPRPSLTLDGGSTAGDGAVSDCVQNPTSPAEVLNRCPLPGTERVDKNPNLPLLGTDGKLPALP